MDADALIASLRHAVAVAESRASAYAARWRATVGEAAACRAAAAAAEAAADRANRSAAVYRGRFLAAIAALGLDEDAFLDAPAGAEPRADDAGANPSLSRATTGDSGAGSLGVAGDAARYPAAAAAPDAQRPAPEAWHHLLSASTVQLLEALPLSGITPASSLVPPPAPGAVGAAAALLPGWDALSVSPAPGGAATTGAGEASFSLVPLVTGGGLLAGAFSGGAGGGGSLSALSVPAASVIPPPAPAAATTLPSTLLAPTLSLSPLLRPGAAPPLPPSLASAGFASAGLAALSALPAAFPLSASSSSSLLLALPAAGDASAAATAGADGTLRSRGGAAAAHPAAAAGSGGGRFGGGVDGGGDDDEEALVAAAMSGGGAYGDDEEVAEEEMGGGSSDGAGDGSSAPPSPPANGSAAAAPAPRVPATPPVKAWGGGRRPVLTRDPTPPPSAAPPAPPPPPPASDDGDGDGDADADDSAAAAAHEEDAARRWRCDTCNFANDAWRATCWHCGPRGGGGAGGAGAGAGARVAPTARAAPLKPSGLAPASKAAAPAAAPTPAGTGRRAAKAAKATGDGPAAVNPVAARLIEHLSAAALAALDDFATGTYTRLTYPRTKKLFEELALPQCGPVVKFEDQGSKSTLVEGFLTMPAGAGGGGETVRVTAVSTKTQPIFEKSYHSLRRLLDEAGVPLKYKYL